MRGTTYLFLGRVVSRIVGIIGGLFLIRLLTPEEYGLIYVAGVVPGVLGILCGWFGLGPAVIKFIAEYRSKGRLGDVRQIIYSSLAFSLGTSAIMTAVCYLFAGDLTRIILNRSDIAPLIRISAFFILNSALYFSAESILIGLEAVGTYTTFMILNECLMKILPIAAVVAHLGVSGVLLGMVFAGLISNVFGVLMALRIEAQRSSPPSLSSRQALKTLLIYGIPLGMTDLLSLGLERFYGLMVAMHCSTYEIGNYQAAGKAVSFISYLTFPVFTALLPALSKIDPEKEPDLLRKAYAYCVRYSSLLVLPAIAAMAVLARPITTFLFGEKYQNAWLYLALLSVTKLTFGLGGPHLQRVFTAQGHTKLVAKLDALTTLLAVCLGLALIPPYGIIGLIITSFASQWPSYLLAVKMAHERYGISPPLRGVWRVYILAMMVGVLIMPVTLMLTDQNLQLIGGAIIGVTTYIIIAPLTRILTERDIRFLRRISKGQPVIEHVFSKVLGVMEFISNMRVS